MSGDADGVAEPYVGKPGEGGVSETIIVLGERAGRQAPVRWAAEHLAAQLRARGATAQVMDEGAVANDAGGRTQLEVGLATDRVAARIGESGMLAPTGPEAFVLAPSLEGDGALIVGSDDRGAAYGLLELADRVRYGDDPDEVVRGLVAESQRPATPVRSVLRTFVSEVQDREWFCDREFWAEYLSELATQRINRVQLALGMQHNYSHDVALEDYYLCFAYPYLLEVPGWDVVAEGLPARERDENLAALRFASDEAARRGIHFQLGLWNHAYDPGESPDLRYRIRGIGADNHAEYCRAALAQLLRECPGISGLTFRVHYEGGIAEIGQERFWGTVLAGIADAGRAIEIDFHAKGVGEELIALGEQAGSPLVLSAKYWAEHQGLPYHQSSIRALEAARPADGSGIDAKTHFTRRFTRYGYGDFLREDRRHELIFRIWPGTQRVLLWGDPVLAAGYGRLGTFAGALGIELCEPLSFKGRKGSGAKGARDPYVDPELHLGSSDWKKYLYTYRLWGRLLYDPDASPASWRRYLRSEYGEAAEHVEAALGAVSRVLPLVTTAHGIGASNNGYWPEVYLNMPLAGGGHSEHYARDTAEPATYGSISSFDPGLFSSIDEHVEEVLADRRSGRHSPEDVAEWLEQLAAHAQAELGRAEQSARAPKAASFRRVAIDVRAQIGLARFFAGKQRAGVAYGFYQRSGDVDFLDQAVEHYVTAREALASVVAATKGVYQDDLAFGNREGEHGHWADRLVDVDADLAALREELAAADRAGARHGARRPAAPAGQRPALDHRAPSAFRPGQDLVIEASVPASFSGQAVLRYRHVNQGESYEETLLEGRDGQLCGVIPGSYTASPYPLQYFFVLSDGAGAWVSPGLDVEGEIRLANQPYYLVRSDRRSAAGTD